MLAVNATSCACVCTHAPYITTLMTAKCTIGLQCIPPTITRSTVSWTPSSNCTQLVIERRHIRSSRCRRRRHKLRRRQNDRSPVRRSARALPMVRYIHIGTGPASLPGRHGSSRKHRMLPCRRRSFNNTGSTRDTTYVGLRVKAYERAKGCVTVSPIGARHSKRSPVIR